MRLVECVPNISEGRDRAIIDRVAEAIGSVEGVKLLDVDPGEATNRTVLTFVGPPDAVEEAAFRTIATAAELIDMRHHHGEHPRMGATDVCPFVPLEGVSMADCVEMARRLGRRVGEELGIPVYLYGEAATSDDRRLLANVRKGEYEGLADREDPPDFGPPFNPKAGATAIGARTFLIAYNVNLNTKDRRLANQIAGALRESGRPKRGPDGKILRNPDGSAIREPGRFKHLAGVGWYIEEYGRAQVSYNLTNPESTTLHDVFDATCEEAEKLGLRVTGSEIVGLVPRFAILAAGDHYLARQGQTTGVPEREKVEMAVLSLGLDDVAPFDPLEKIIEYRFQPPVRGFGAMRLADFVDRVATLSPTPGGGSVAATVGALSAALAAMVTGLTWPKTRDEAMVEVGSRAQDLKAWFLDAADRDTAAFEALMNAYRLPKATEDERQARQEAIDAATFGAARVPLEVLERCVEALDLCEVAATDGIETAVTDAGVGAACALAAAEGASLNVRINLTALAEDPQAAEFDRRRSDALLECRTRAERVLDLVSGKI